MLSRAQDRRPIEEGRFVVVSLTPLISAVWPLLALLLVTGWAAPAVRKQRFVSKPNMLFSDSAVFTYNSARLLPQLEPGSATSGGAQNAGCTACR